MVNKQNDPFRCSSFKWHSKCDKKKTVEWLMLYFVTGIDQCRLCLISFSGGSEMVSVWSTLQADVVAVDRHANHGIFSGQCLFYGVQPVDYAVVPGEHHCHGPK